MFVSLIEFVELVWSVELVQSVELELEEFELELFVKLQIATAKAELGSHQLATVVLDS